jgi:UDP-glucose 4-epimerase
MVEAFGAACGKPVAYEVCPRRPGDIAECWASTTKAENDLGWKATRTVDEMTADTWKWQSLNPNGY